MDYKVLFMIRWITEVSEVCECPAVTCELLCQSGFLDLNMFMILHTVQCVPWEWTPSVSHSSTVNSEYNSRSSPLEILRHKQLLSDIMFNTERSSYHEVQDLPESVAWEVFRASRQREERSQPTCTCSLVCVHDHTCTLFSSYTYAVWPAGLHLPAISMM